MSEARVVPAVSVVVINKDEREIKRSLDLLRPQVEAFPDGAEVIIVDASEGRLDDIRDGAPWARWIPFTRPIGARTSIPHQRNVGVRAAHGRVIAFCDAGGEPADGWLEALVRPVLDGRQHAASGPVAAIGESVYGVMTDIADGEIPATPPTANMAFTRAVFDAVGGFDEAFRYGSDVDFAWRLEDNGTPVRQVRSAVMHMDWGDRKRQIARSRLYGAGQAQLWMKHRHRWKALPRTVPVLVVYPLWLLGLAPALVQLLRRRPALLAVWLAVPGALVAKNRREPNPTEVVRQNTLFGLGALEMLAKKSVRRSAPVLFVPKEDGIYQGRLRSRLVESGTNVEYLDGPTRSHGVNLVLLPLRTATARLGGARIVHVHWTYDFCPAWARRSPIASRALRWWFAGWLGACKALGLKVVWTAHNLLPHTPVFDDDEKARRTLVAAADAVIALSEASADELDGRWDARPTVIPAAVDSLPSMPRRTARRLLGLPETGPVVGWFGLVEPYKGVDRLVEAALLLPDVTFVLMGMSRDPARTADLVARLRDQPNVRWENRRVSDDELATLCSASDLLAFPFTAVTNSGSVLTALAAGRPVAIPALESLGDIPDACAARFGSATPPEIAATIEAHFALPDDARAAMSAAASAHTASVGWDAVADAHNALYRRLGA